MYKIGEVLALANKFDNSFKNHTIPELPQDLLKQLTSLRELVCQQTHTNGTLLTQVTISLLIRVYLLGIGILDREAHYTNEEKIRIANNIITCANLVGRVLTQSNNEEAFIDLEKMLHAGTFELRAFTSWKHLFLSAIDNVINGVNTGRALIFRSTYSRSRLATREIISETLQEFLFVAKNQFTTRSLLSSLQPTETFSNFYLAENHKAHILHLDKGLSDLYQAFYHYHQQDRERISAAKAMIESLDYFAKQSALAKDNQIINAYAEQAFLASQELVIELLKDSKPSVQRMKRLAACFEQTAHVIANPGKKSEVKKLEKLVEESDYKRFHCDKEKTAYAIIHILVSAALLALAIVEAVVSHGISLAAHLWIIGAEGGSLGVGFGQLYYFSSSEIKTTFFADSMSKLAQVTRSKSKHEDWRDKGDIENRREQLLNTLYQDSLANNFYNKEVKQLLSSLQVLRNNVHQSKQTLIYSQAHAVLQSAEELAIDLVRSKYPSQIRIQKLRECVDAANAVVLQPENVQAINQLVTLVSHGDYEAKKIIKRDIVIASLLALASIALYIVTITGTIFSAGATSGTILSPIMLSAVAAHKFANSIHRERTRFSEEAKALTEFAQTAGKNLTSPSQISECPDETSSFPSYRSF
ncbi:hypothetical protein [Legionella micdadei]|uniref:Uncharacterized protein n=1 Tax=Legionella micdadei TaxID=451 RepID=A0A098GI28_LEGMI|nr:hypothetical protein [Legionella micdadei]ARG98556.1 hypothetical protein B6N58_13320 [Legionella micdadei]KTD27416.1 hypothetical protein Lmic_2351 [Legionella micdadei]NSL19374.1 hypothetical protein [Legionella micdadei]CEG62124.1 membrane protein of unknown function [Legionella micdadei]SCY74092.1 hypothetical protein SAMN02982997_02735 [Legionella micdadei]